MMGRKGPKRGLARGVRDRKPGGSSWLRILCSVCQWMPYSWHAWRLLISPVRTRRRISAHASMSVYTPASCRTASDHGRDRYRTAGTALERYTSGSADRTSASAALLDRRLQLHQVRGRTPFQCRLPAVHETGALDVATDVRCHGAQ